MIKQFCQVFWLAGLLVLVTVAPGAANNRPGAFTLTPQVGALVFEGNQGLDPALFGGLALGYNFDARWGVEGVLTYANTETEVSSVAVDVYAAHLDLLYHFQPQKRLVPYLVLAVGGLELKANGEKDTDVLAGYGVGLKYYLPEGVALRLDLKHLFDINAQDVNKSRDFYNMLAATVGVSFQFGGEGSEVSSVRDSDGDGVVDSSDRCPNSRPGERVDASGCAVDADRDGIDDHADLCLGTPAGTRVDASGCPEATPEADTDGDGVTDGSDRCPETPAGTMVDASGCPAGAMDGDGDGVGDASDRCPNTPGFVPVNSYGCPSDTDGDGVFDVDDQCPETSPGGEVGPDGCPFVAGVMAVAPVTAIHGDAMTVRLELPSGEFQVQPKHEAALAKAAAFIAGQPGTRFVVAGHTDSVGPAEFNQQLSKKRAESVRTYLIQRFGIAPERLEARGFGESQPLGDNSTQEGRLMNRRVVIIPTGAP